MPSARHLRHLATLSLVSGLCGLVAGCRAQPVPLARRVPVDLVADCVSLRERLSECGEAAVPILYERRLASRPDLLAQVGEAAVRAEVRAELQREAAMSEEERVRQCRIATAETAPPEPDDVARLHRCLVLSCALRAECLQPLLVPSASPPPGAAPRSPLG